MGEMQVQSLAHCLTQRNGDTMTIMTMTVVMSMMVVTIKNWACTLGFLGKTLHIPGGEQEQRDPG